MRAWRRLWGQRAEIQPVAEYVGRALRQIVGRLVEWTVMLAFAALLLAGAYRLWVGW